MKEFLQKLKKKQDGTNNPNKKAKHSQRKTVLLLIGVVVFVIIFYSWTSGPTKRRHHVTHHFAGPFDDNVGEAYDHARVTELMSEIDKSHADYQTLKKALAAQKADTTQKVSSRTEKQLEWLAKKVDTLQAKLQSMQTKPATPPSIKKRKQAQGKQTTSTKTTSTVTKTSAPVRVPVMNSVGIDDTQIVYSRADLAPKRTPKNYVWAGSFVNGYLLTGIIGDAGTNSTKNKGTVAIRLTTNGVMPNGKHSHLKGCVVLGSSYGDLSSDSDVIRLETLSCASPQYSFEKKVYGSVFDLDAMQDLRGIPVLKAKPILGYATAAGLLAGIGDGLSASGTSSTVTGSGIVQTPTSIVRSGLGSGISKPADKITDYLMSIANMYHPIVVAHAGRKVTVLFQAGFWIDKPHQHYQSMASIDGGTPNNGNSGASGQQQIAPQQAALQNARLTRQVASASGDVVNSAENQAEADFNQHKVMLGQGLFTKVTGGNAP